MKQITQKYFKNFATSLKTLSIIWVVGPAVYTLSMLLGADPMDGAIGTQATNPFFQDFLMTSGFFMSLAATAIGFILSIWLAVTRVKTDKRYLLLPVPAFVMPLALLFLAFVVGGLTIYY